VRFEITEPIEEMSHCHCSMCRKAHGTAFSTYARVARRALRFTAGEDQVRRYRSSAQVERAFCPVCGSKLAFFFDGMPEAMWVTAGSLDGDPGVRPTSHIFVGSKAPWHEITDDLQQHEEYPPEP
jgi:hypothetical protein